ncbi:MAG: hypothetical protein ACLFTH_01175 [Candidatus Woesearchaeota archaeon]
MADEEPTLFPNQPNPEEHVKQHKESQESAFAPVKETVNDIATRLKILEERYSIIRKKTQLAEHSIINLEKESAEEMRLVNDDILELKKTVKDVREKLSLLSDEVENFVEKPEFTKLKKYVGFWNPMDFVTRKEVNDFLRKKFEEEK